jgi:hypothetical protein
LVEAIESIEILRDALADNATATITAIKELCVSCLLAIEQDVREIKANTTEIKANTENPPAKNWAQIASTHQHPHHQPSTSTKALNAAKRKEHIRKQHEPYEVALVTVNDKTKKSIANMDGSTITQRCQDLINAETQTKPKINGITKTANGIRLTCETPNDAELIRTLNWSNAKLNDLQLHKRNYGIVVHRVSTSIVTELGNEAILKEWSEANRINITKVKPLHRKPGTGTPINRHTHA